MSMHGGGGGVARMACAHDAIATSEHRIKKGTLLGFEVAGLQGSFVSSSRGDPHRIVELVSPLLLARS